MSNKKDYYEILGVSKTASADEIKAAYRRLAMKYHPDRNPNDKTAENKFKDAKEAYEILSDAQKRAAYDQFGHDGVSGFGAAGARQGPGGAGFGDFGGIFDDLFSEVFRRSGNAGQAQSGPERGSDLGYRLRPLTLEEAVFGAEEKIVVPTLVNCSECNGSGAKKGTNPTTCKTCGGIGVVQLQQGFFTLQQTCPKCHGRGKVITNPCPKCHGQGHYREEKTLLVRVPAGIDNGDRIRLVGEGDSGIKGGQPGDLYVEITLKPHPIFKRRGKDLYCEMPISFVTAALGGEIEIPTLSGQVKLKIPSETQSGKVFRLHGKGIKSGDLYCTATVETPINLTNDQKDLMKKFAASVESDGKNHNPNAKNWFESLKKFLRK